MKAAPPTYIASSHYVTVNPDDPPPPYPGAATAFPPIGFDGNYPPPTNPMYVPTLEPVPYPPLDCNPTLKPDS